jgi:predicted DNA-binding ArsR family transcriptional regulator
MLGELLDREFQKHVLQTLADHYPHRANVNRVFGSQVDNRLLVNLKYLEEHRLIDVHWTAISSGLHAVEARISASGLDFLADDGGLSAILDVVVVKLDDSTIRELIAQKIFEAEVDTSMKSRIVDALRALPADGIKAVTMRTLEVGLNDGPQLVKVLRSILNI